MTIGQRIKQCRELKKITQEELGKICNTTKQTIFKYETGVITNIPMDRLCLIANALGVSPAFLMGWDDPVRASSMAIESHTEAQLISSFRELNEDGQTAAIKYIDYLSEQPEYIKTDIYRQVENEA